MDLNLSARQREDIEDILDRRANEIAGYLTEHQEKIPGSVELALHREITRLRDLGEKVNPQPVEEDEE